MFYEYLNPPPCVDPQVPTIIALEPAVSTGTPSSTTIDQDAPSSSTSQTTQETPLLVIPLGVEEAEHDIEVVHMDNNPKSYKEALTESCWIEAMQEELDEFKHLEVWELVPRPNRVMIITFKWIYKVKLDELGGVLKNKARLSPRGTFLNQSKYALDSLRKYGMETYEPTDTPMVEKSKLDEDPQRKVVDPTCYRGMIGTLMYLTSSRPDLDSCIVLTTFADADHAGCQDTRKSTSGSMQLLGGYAQILWMRSQLMDYGLVFNKIPL
ncbi:retrovirus-related pol polyprotein from transposon TNT 1-94 [Tanacetum coccineum]|uniref:Retrovirus-related pol polyprotein from transposon TNT 1-94 n=1 Tax=Tanacetum coccineum TaxID=301880 RepID=A0ABQ4YYQ1_9ASTR